MNARDLVADPRRRVLRVGAHVSVDGRGYGDVVEILPPHYEGDRRGRRVHVNYGLCRHCETCRCERVAWESERFVRVLR